MLLSSPASLSCYSSCSAGHYSLWLPGSPPLHLRLWSTSCSMKTLTLSGRSFSQGWYLTGYNPPSHMATFCHPWISQFSFLSYMHVRTRPLSRYVRAARTRQTEAWARLFLDHLTRPASLFLPPALRGGISLSFPFLPCCSPLLSSAPHPLFANGKRASRAWPPLPHLSFANEWTEARAGGRWLEGGGVSFLPPLPFLGKSYH